MTVAVYTPDGRPPRTKLAAAHRPVSLSGLRVGTLDNGKVPGAALLAEARRRLLTEGTVEGATVVKRSPGQRLDPKRLEQLADTSDAVINALAD